MRLAAGGEHELLAGQFSSIDELGDQERLFASHRQFGRRGDRRFQGTQPVAGRKRDTMAVQHYRGPAERSVAQRTANSSSLADVLNVILDKGIVIDAWARVSVIGIEILTIEARVVVASVETYLRYAEAIGSTALAAAPVDERFRGYQQDGRGWSGDGRVSAPSTDEVADYLSDHPDGTRMGDLQAYFDAPRDELSDILNDLVDEKRARRDDQRRLYFAAGTSK
jgi:hypothetical protein